MLKISIPLQFLNNEYHQNYQQIIRMHNNLGTIEINDEENQSNTEQKR